MAANSNSTPKEDFRTARGYNGITLFDFRTEGNLHESDSSLG
jgi:hypothetical protein